MPALLPDDLLNPTAFAHAVIDTRAQAHTCIFVLHWRTISSSRPKELLRLGKRYTWHKNARKRGSNEMRLQKVYTQSMKICFKEHIFHGKKFSVQVHDKAPHDTSTHLMIPQHSNLMIPQRTSWYLNTVTTHKRERNAHIQKRKVHDGDGGK